MNSCIDGQVAIVGGGFTGLAVAYELARRGVRVVVLESDENIGGLAGAFPVGGERLDRFYHHWFLSDGEIISLIAELGLDDRISILPTNTGVFVRGTVHKLSTPLDLLRFSPLSIPDRVRLGLLALRARRVRDWRALESQTAAQWLCALGGQAVYETLWQPLLRGKFGPYAEDVSAVWIWNKLKLRGGSRGRRGEERLAYFTGGFIALAEAMAKKIQEWGGRIELKTPVTEIRPDNGRWMATTPRGRITARRIVATTALPVAAELISGWADPDYLGGLRAVRYLGNICLVLELDRALGQTYWLNVTEPDYPFVAVIEHTNFVPPQTYGGRHIVYLSKYLPETDPLFSLSGDEFLAYALPCLTRIHPHLRPEWVLGHHLWRARWSQPVVEKQYSRLIPAQDSPWQGLHLCTMAQIYPEDRGTNYAVREGRAMGVRLARLLH